MPVGMRRGVMGGKSSNRKSPDEKPRKMELPRRPRVTPSCRHFFFGGGSRPHRSAAGDVAEAALPSRLPLR